MTKISLNELLQILGADQYRIMTQSEMIRLISQLLELISNCRENEK